MHDAGLIFLGPFSGIESQAPISSQMGREQLCKNTYTYRYMFLYSSALWLQEKISVKVNLKGSQNSVLSRELSLVQWVTGLLYLWFGALGKRFNG